MYTQLNTHEIRSEFALDTDVTYLNHASFGAVPNDVLDERARWLNQADRNPTALYQRELDAYLGQALSDLAKELAVAEENLAWMPNVTFALNLVARSVMSDLRPGDEVLLTDLEYGHQFPLWRWVCEKTGATLKIAPVYRFRDEDRARSIIDAVTPKTRVLLMSHITSGTALVLPVQEVCNALAERNVITIVDGAHAPGHIELRPSTIGCDYYAADLHKWQVAPINSAFLYASKDRQARLEPLVIGWGGTDSSRSLNERTSRPGTFDSSAWLSVPQALDFHRKLLLPAAPFARARLRLAVAKLESLGFAAISSKPEYDTLLMSSLLLPEQCSLERLSAILLREKVEVALTTQETDQFLRISVAWYTTDGDIERLLSCCEMVLR